MIYLWAPLYVWAQIAVIGGMLLWMPYTGKEPPGTYAKADRFPPAPPIAEIGPKIESRIVAVERIPRPKPRDSRAR